MWGGLFKVRAVVGPRAEGGNLVSVSHPVLFVLPQAVFHFSGPELDKLFSTDSHSQDAVTIAKMFDTHQKIRK